MSLNESTNAQESKAPMVVGIGASAGGLTALKTLFRNVPSDSGLAFVIVVHLSPEHKSHLADLLQPGLGIPVQQVSETIEIEANHVYVIPPGRNLSAIDTHLRLSDLEERRQQRAPIDHFFRTLASAHDGRAIGIVLSGTGSDGTLGIREIKTRGGLTIVQDPKDAEHDGMPQSAIATGMVDMVLPVSEIAAAVLRFAHTEPKIQFPSDGESADSDEGLGLQKIFVQLRARTGRDFSRYKPATIMRRIARRMQLSQIEDLNQYVEKLRQDPDEGRALSDDLLITVTNFFRDRDVFERLESQIVPQVFDAAGTGGTIRAWSVGCATGEEAYSLAILLLEESARRESLVSIQVFASDLHERSLAKAREGNYPGDIETDVSPERLRKYFQKQNSGYRIRKEVRDLVIFAPHNLLADPPFSKINIITCRNLLIYLQRQIQYDVIDLFHYALAPNGYLILGASEAIEAPQLFHTEDKAMRIYRKRNVPGPEPRLRVFPLSRTQTSDSNDNVEYMEPVVAYGTFHQRMVERYAPPSVLVSPDAKVVHFSEHAGKYFTHSGGEPTLNVFKLVRPELRFELRSLIHDAQTRHGFARSRPIAVEIDGVIRDVVLHAHPALEPSEEGYILVIFEDWVAQPNHPGESDDAAVSNSPAAGIAGELQADLELIRHRLQATLEEHETSLEEMKASNEELQSTNEELRSTLEELETSKEELQSMNEELQTVNQENRHKVEELALLSSDLQNLLTATDIATLFLDRELRILRFTPKVSDLFSVRLTDRGRPVSDLTHRLGYYQLKMDAETVLSRLVPVEREVRDESGNWYLTRVLPYRSGEDRIEGVVITFVDISEHKRSEEALQQAREDLATELTVMTRLHELVGRLLLCPDLQTALDEVLIATIEISGADMGHVQLLDPLTGTLKVAASRGFENNSLNALQGARVVEDGSTFGRALKDSQRIIVDDVRTESDEVQQRLAAAAGFRAVQSTPLLSFKGKTMGVLSTHWKEPHHPSERELRTLDLYCRQASEFIERSANEDALRDADKKKDEFLAILAHELRNPLAPIRNAAEILKRSPDDAAVGIHTVERIDRQVVQLSHLIDDLLDVSRISLRKIKLHKETVAVTSCIEQAIEVIQPLCDTKRQTLHVSAPEDLYITADPVRLAQIIGNLLSNACKFTKHGGEIELDVTLEDSEQRTLVIYVRDSGAGIAASELSRIFEMFQQVDTSLERTESGLGIGLTLVKHLVELHGGTVSVHSGGLGKGSTFVVRLPGVIVSRDGAPSRTADGPHFDGHAHRILVVDDNRDSADSLATILRMSGHEVSTAYDGMEAVEVAERILPRVVLLDLGLPKLNGFETARRIRERHPDRKVTIFAVSGWNQPEDRRRSSEAGFDGHLVKPVDFAKLEEMLKKLSP